MKQYALNDTVHELLSAFAAQPQGSLLITGPIGSGLTTSMTYVVKSMYGQNPRPGEVIYLEDYTMAGVRRLINQLSRTRVNVKKPRLIVIDDADKLALEPQNALLKSIEEPPDNTHFLLTTSQEEKLLETIQSRCSRVALKRPAKEDLHKIFSEYSSSEFEKAFAIADGWPGALRDMLENTDSEITRQVGQAKEFLTSPVDRRVISSGSLDSDQMQSLIEGLLRISHTTMRSCAVNGKESSFEQWQKRAKNLHQLEEDLRNGVSVKLVGLSLSQSV